jgi:hypothetical protein
MTCIYSTRVQDLGVSYGGSHSEYTILTYGKAIFALYHN